MNNEINFIFIRHGESCQNLVANLYHKYDPKFNELLRKYVDPTLSDTGILDSIKSGILLKDNLKKYNINNFDFIASSNMIRAIETAFLMTLNLNYNKKQIINVCPYLRETRTPNSIIETIKSFPIKALVEQKNYFSNKLIDNINFSYISENKYSNKPGNIKKFIKWFAKNILIKEIPLKNKPINILVFLHSIVMGEFSNKIPKNNTGFILQTRYNVNNDTIEYSTEDIYMHHTEFDFKRSKLICPSVSCPGLC